MKKPIVPLLILTVYGAFLGFVHHEYYKHKEMPPGYHLACDGKGHYAPAFDDVGVFKSCREKPSSKQEAINKAWEQYEFELRTANEPPETNTINWQECDK